MASDAGGRSSPQELEELSAEAILARKRRVLIDLMRLHYGYGASLHRNQDTVEYAGRLLGVPLESYAAAADVIFIRFLDPLPRKAGAPPASTAGDALPHLETRFVKLSRGFDLYKLDLVTDLFVRMILHARKHRDNEEIVVDVEAGKASVEGAYVVDGEPVRTLQPPPPTTPEEQLSLLKTAEDELARIEALPPLWPAWVKNLIVSPLISAGMALIFFDAPWIGAALALPVGLIPGLLTYLKPRTNPLYSYMFELFICLIVGFLSGIIVGTNAFPGLCFGSLALSGIVWYIPGLPLVLSAMELMTQSSSVGASRLIYCILLILLMGFGIDTGLLLSNFIPMPLSPVQPCKPAGIPLLYYLAIYPFVGLLHCIMMEAKFPSQYILAIPPAGLAFAAWVGLQQIEWIQKAGSAGFGMVVTLASFGGTLCGFLYARFTRRSAFTVIYMVFQFIVPGALSIKASLSSLNSPAGFLGPTFFERVLTGVLGCCVGTFAAHILVWPVREDQRERWAFMPYR